MSFQHVIPSLRVFQGPDSLRSLGRELERLEKRRALIFCGASLVRQGSLLSLVQSELGDRCAGVFERVSAHSPLVTVETAAAQLDRVRADVVIALGGGSAVVTARAASILLAEKMDAKSLATFMDERGELRSPRLLAPKLTQIIIPTTPTTAMVKAGSAVLDSMTGKRLALFDPKTRAQCIFIHPEAVNSAPRELILSASLNVCAMAIEGLMSRSGDSLADGLLMHALRLLALQLPDHRWHEDPAVRAELILAAILCGQGTDYTSAGITTVLGHAIGTRAHMQNGIGNAIVLPHVLRFNADAAEAGLLKVAVALGLHPSDTEPVGVVVSWLESLLRRLGVPRRLRDAGVAREALPEIAADSMGDWFLRGNPRLVRNVSELELILDQAW